MVKNSSKQTGSVFVAIIIILVIAIGSVTGFIFWQNFMSGQKQDIQTAQTTAKVQQTPPKQVTYKTYQTDTHPVSFSYPDTWKVENVQSDNQYFFRSANITTDQGNIVSFSVGGDGLGGTCGGSNIPIRSTVDVTSTTLKTPKLTTLSFTVTHLTDGSYDATYGLTDEYTQLNDTETCDNTFYYFADTGNDIYHLIGFKGTKHFATLDDAKNFVKSDEYAAIKKMILSLNY